MVTMPKTHILLLPHRITGVIPQDNCLLPHRGYACIPQDKQTKKNQEKNKEVTKAELAENTLTATTPFLLTQGKVKRRKSKEASRELLLTTATKQHGGAKQ